MIWHTMGMELRFRNPRTQKGLNIIFITKYFTDRINQKMCAKTIRHHILMFSKNGTVLFVNISYRLKNYFV